MKNQKAVETGNSDWRQTPNPLINDLFLKDNKFFKIRCFYLPKVLTSLDRSFRLCKKGLK